MATSIQWLSLIPQETANEDLNKGVLNNAIKKTIRRDKRRN